MAQKTYITRCDVGLGDGAFDSIAWAFDTHIKAEDTGEYNSAMLYGNEDAPDKIEFYREAVPRYDAVPAWVWYWPLED